MRFARVVAIVIPLAVFYAIVALRFFSRLVDRRYARRSGPRWPIAPLPQSAEMTLAAIVLDLSVLMQSLSGLWSGKGAEGTSSSSLVAVLLLLFHAQLYLFAQFLERGRLRRPNFETMATDAVQVTDPVLLFVGILALFTNAASLMAVL